MARSISPLPVVAVLLILISALPMVAQAPAKSVTITTDSSEYFIGQRVQAMLIVDYTGGVPPLGVEFQWYDPLGVMIFNEAGNLTIYASDKYGASFSNWTSNKIGVNFRVVGIHIGSGFTDEAYFNVSTYDEAVVVEDLFHDLCCTLSA